MSRLSCFALLLGILTFSPIQLSRAASLPPREPSEGFVLILSSYTYGNEWSTSLAKEIQGRLKDARSDLRTSITYADITSSTSLLADRFAMQGAFSYGRLTAHLVLPKLLILIGDESWMLYRIMDLRGVWESVPVVLCGMHSEIMRDYGAYFVDRQIADSALIPLSSSTGNFRAAVVEEPDNTDRTLHLIRTLHPKCNRLYYLSNGTYSDRYTKKRLLQAIDRHPHPFTLTELVNSANRTDSVKRQLANLPEGSLLLTNGIDPPELAPDIPVITLRDMAYNNRLPQGGYFATIGDLAAKTVDATLKVLNNAPPKPVAVASDTAYYLNQTALNNARLGKRAETLMPSVRYRNIPPPFVIRYIRQISAGALLLIVLGFIFFRILSSYLYRRNLRKLYGQYKSLYDEYQAVYENMPIGVMLFDRDGNLLQSNAAAAELLPDEELRRSIFRKDKPNQTIDRNGYSYYIMFRQIADEAGEDHLLFIVVDHTEIERMRKDKERIYNVFNFAMNKSGIGVASYNLINRQGFATNAWFQLLDINQAKEQHLIEHTTLVPGDRKRVEQYLKKVRYGVSQPFLQNLKVTTADGTMRNLRCYIKPIDYFPNDGYVTVAEIMVNVDAQVQREDELKAFMAKAQESERLKYAFVANIRDDIRLPWHNIATFAEELADSTDFNRRQALYKQIESNSAVLLDLVRQFIESSQQESLNPQMPTTA